jgi:hypothetical protein
MSKFSLFCAASLAVFVLSCLTLAPAVQAQQARFVSSTGNNANDCTRDAPCRTLQTAIDAVPQRGVVQILDSGTYGQTITITKSVNVVATGVAATIGVITINAPNAVVALRGLHITGRNNTTSFGTLSVDNAASVFVEDCDVEGAPGIHEGMRVNADDALVTIKGSTFRDNGFYGLIISTNSTGAQAVVENSRFLNNGSAGIHNVGSASEISIDQSVVAGNANGVFVGNGATVRVSNSTIVNNSGNGLINSAGSPGTLLSRGNNTVSGNGTNTSGTITALGGL